MVCGMMDSIQNHRRERGSSDVEESAIPLLQIAGDAKIEQLSNNNNADDVVVQINSTPLRDPFHRMVKDFCSSLHRIIYGPEPSVKLDHVHHFATKGALYSTSVRTADRLEDPTDLHSYITNYLSVIPPQVYMRVKGSHREVAQSISQSDMTITDFDFIIDIRGFFGSGDGHDDRSCTVATNDEETYRGTSRKSIQNRTKEDLESGARSEKSLLEWCQHYCGSQHPRRSFRVTRRIRGLGLSDIRKGVISLLRPQYFGNIEIGFTVVDVHVDIYPQRHIDQKITTRKRRLPILWVFGMPFFVISLALTIGFVGWFIAVIFTLFFNNSKGEAAGFASNFFHSFGIFVGVALGVGTTIALLLSVVDPPFPEKKWHIYTVHWDVSKWVEVSGRRVLKYAGLSESQWLLLNGALLRRLAERNFEGDATSFLDAAPAH
jgi:hypothetical protein